MRREALTHYQAAGDALRVGDSLRWLSRLSWFVGRKEDADSYGNEAVSVLQQLPPGSELAMAYSNLSQLHMLADDTDAALVWGEKAMELARNLRDDQRDQPCTEQPRELPGSREGRSRRVERSCSEASIWRWPTTSRSTRRVPTPTSAPRPSTVAVTRSQNTSCGMALPTASTTTLTLWRLYMEAELARVLADRGRFDDAARLARNVLRHPNLSAVTKIDALTAAGSVAIRRGQPDAEMLLTQAQSLAEPTGESQRLTPVAAAAAELAWTDGKDATRSVP